MIQLPTALVLIGHPVAHSLSPRFQNAALERAGLRLVYEAIDVPPPELSRCLAELRRNRAAGNVTVPHKQAVCIASNCRSDLAELTGAVNTFKHDEGGRLHGHNTDVGGIAHAVHTLLGAAPDTPVAILGAGGAAAAALAAARNWETEVRLRSRDYDRARELVNRIMPEAHIMRRASDAVDGAGLVINTTTLGMRDDDELPCDFADLEPGAALFDVVYRADETRWVREARARGHRAADGMEMLLEQGALAFEWWFGVTPDRAAMRAVMPAR